MDAATFYSGEADYLLETRTLLAENGNQVLKALRTPSSNYEGPQTAAAGFAPIPEVDLYELAGFSNGNNSKSGIQSSSGSGSLADLSGHVRVTNPDGDIEEYYMTVTPHLLPLDNSSSAAKRGVAQQAAAGDQPSGSDNAWIALDVDQFYVSEDENGEEIWPVTIPAQSLSNPEQIIELTVHGDGRLEWPEEALGSNTASKTNSLAFGINPELNYLSANEMAIIQPSDGGGGSGSTGTNQLFSNIQNNFNEMEVVNGAFLSLKSLRLHQGSDGGGAAEVIMNVGFGDEDTQIFKDWAHSFDRKRGLNGENDGLLKRLKDGFKTGLVAGLNVVVGTLTHNQLVIGTPDTQSDIPFLFQPHLFFDVIIQEIVGDLSLFEGKNQFTIGADMAIYKVPDINRAGVKYTFRYMKKYTFSILQNIVPGQQFDTSIGNLRQLDEFTEAGYDNYFPLVPLSNDGSKTKWKFVLTENDKKYPKFSSKGISLFGGKTRKKNIWVYDMSTGRYNFEEVELEAKGHLFGNSDDIYERSGVKNITARNASDRLNFGEIRAEKDNFEYVFTVEGKNILCSR